ncbi:uncharacterized protein LOC129751614 [Uranotaenia lowii]|uniref:uncharacterized protein LOC129751614 n=1 Tax=Uranotaenia lowii TaxID=190385 RepID=UPI00247AF6AC|nr:uncharacterized protein LOC129751614 [Uranotaenia lowii]
MTNRSDEAINSAISSISNQSVTPEHFVNRSVPVLFTSRRGLRIRKFHSMLNTGQASYTVQFCDLERWTNHFKLSSVGLTPESSTTMESSNLIKQQQQQKNVKFVRQSPQSQHEQQQLQNVGSINRDNG